MEYKVYKIDKGYKLVHVCKNKNDLFFLLDLSILEQNTQSKILVVQYDEITDTDFPYLLYTGNVEDYKLMKEVLCDDIRENKKQTL